MRQLSKAHRGEPPILLVKWYDVTKWLLERVDSFPKNQRFILGQAAGGNMQKTPMKSTQNGRCHFLTTTVLNSGRRGSNPRHSRWQRDALPLSYARDSVCLYHDNPARPEVKRFFRSR